MNFLFHLTHHLLSLPCSQRGFFLNYIHFSQNFFPLFASFPLQTTSFHFLATSSLLNANQIPHSHKASIVSHFPPTFRSFFITFKIIWTCYCVKCGLLWLQLPLLHVSASLMQLKCTVGSSGDLHTGMME